MVGKCDWCRNESDNLKDYKLIGQVSRICPKCMEAADNDTCRTCGVGLDGDVAINGECNGCIQIRAAKAEKHRSEIMNGLGVDVLAELTHSVVFTEEDYERWVTFSQGNFTPEVRKANRRKWIKNKLETECGWLPEVFDSNVEDIEYLLDNYSHKIFNKSCTFIIKDSKSKGIKGVIIEKRGNVMVVNKD